MFYLTNAVIDPRARARAMANAHSGGFVSFEGWVRNHHQGRGVIGLSYHSYQEMALSEGAAICRQANERFDVDAVECVHRLGDLGIGDCAVWVGISAAHRAAAFAACEYIIDQIKLHVPIWKHEAYADGHSEWVGCVGCHSHRGTGGANERYVRQMAFPGIAENGQRRLRDSHVLVVGMGALGCPVADSLVTAGVGRVSMVDGDTVDISNLHRQPLYSENDLGRKKVHAAADRLRVRNADVDIVPVAAWLDDHGAQKLIQTADLVIDCTDSAVCKQRVSTIAKLRSTPWIVVGIYRQDGGIYVSPESSADGVCWNCLTGGSSTDCTVSGILGPSATALGALAANEALKRLAGMYSGLVGRWSVLEMGEGRWTTFTPRRQQDCDCRVSDDAVELCEAGPEYTWLDIRDESERLESPVARAVVVDSLVLDARPESVLRPDKRYLIICKRGTRSLRAVHTLRARGWKQVWSLQGGVKTALAASVSAVEA